MLSFSESTGDKPIIHDLIKRFDICINIIKAEMAPGLAGSMLAEFSAPEAVSYTHLPQRMPDVEARPGRIRKHVEHIILGAGSVRVHPVSPAPLPLLLPARLYFAEIVLHKFVFVFLSCIRKDRKYIIEI